MEKLIRLSKNDRPELAFPNNGHDKLSIPQQLGFINDQGVEIQIPRERAIGDGLVVEEEVPKTILPVKEYVSYVLFQEGKKRQVKLADGTYATDINPPGVTDRPFKKRSSIG